MCLLLSGGCNGMLVCLARCTFILHCSANATQLFVSRLQSFLVGEENKDAGSRAVSYTPCTFGCTVCCTCGLRICTHLPAIVGLKQPYLFLYSFFCAGKVQVVQMEWGPLWAAVQHWSTVHTAVLYKEKWGRHGQRWKGRVKIAPGLITHTHTVTGLNESSNRV